MFMMLHHSSMAAVERLSVAEVKISTNYQQNMMKLESRYKLLIDDLIDEKLLIQQKLYQSFQNQMKKLFELKLSYKSNNSTK